METNALRQKILDLAIRGKLVSQDPNDEPASVLLERIRAEKQQMVRDGKLKKKDIENDTIIFVGEDNLHYEKFADGTVKCIEDEIPFELPEGWAICRFADLFNICSSKRVLKSDWRENGIPFYRAREIAKLAICGTVNNELYISQEHYEKLKKEYGVPQKGDLMITGVGTIGKVYIVNEGDIFYYKDASVLCFQNSYNAIIPEFAKLLIESELIQSQIHSKTYGNTVDTITITTANNYLCVLPPLEEQSQIYKKVSTLTESLLEIEKHRESISSSISSLKSRILDLAIRGKLVPQDPNDEPASVLLERIRAEKEELIKQGKIKRDKNESVIFKGEDNSYYERLCDGTEKCIDDEIPFEIPNTWIWCRASTIGSTNIGLTYSPANIAEVGTMVLRSSNIIDGEVDFTDLVRVNSTIRENQYLNDNDILFCARNGSRRLVGKCALIRNNSEPMSFGAFMAVYRCKLNQFLYYFFNTETFRTLFITDDSKQINQLTQDIIKNTLLPIPPKEEQHAIVNAIKLYTSLLNQISISLL